MKQNYKKPKISLQYIYISFVYGCSTFSKMGMPSSKNIPISKNWQHLWAIVKYQFPNKEPISGIIGIANNEASDFLCQTIPCAMFQIFTWVDWAPWSIGVKSLVIYPFLAGTYSGLSPWLHWAVWNFLHEPRRAIALVSIYWTRSCTGCFYSGRAL